MIRILLALCMFVLLACSSPVAPLPDAGAPPDLTLSSAEYTVQPGEEIQYLNTPIKPPGALAIRKVQPHYGPGVHHAVQWRVLPLFAAGLPTEPYQSPEIAPVGHIPLYVGGTSETALETPPGTAFDVPAEDTLIMQLHLLWTGSAPVTGKTTLDLWLTEEPHEPANVYAFDNATFEIPPQTQGFKTSVTCTLAADLEVFAVWPHMHAQGDAIEVTRNGQPWWSQDHWDLYDQPIVYFESSLSQGDEITITCTMHNASAFSVPRATGGAGGMCSLLAYHSGPSAGKFFACVDGQTISL